VSPIGKGLWRVVVHYGFFEAPDVPRAMRLAAQVAKLPVDVDQLTYYIGRETLLSTGSGVMGRFSERCLAMLSRNSVSATAYFAIPSRRVVELGMQIDMDVVTSPVAARVSWLDAGSGDSTPSAERPSSIG
jgi:KUP system potassium uptake protein